MSRLLFAAARGARIEVEPLDGVWITSRKVPYTKLQKCPSLYRIHPDDAHLAYGPISTALRERAVTGEEQYAGLPYLRGYFFFEAADERTAFSYGPLSDNAVFLLIMAEALADEGL